MQTSGDPSCRATALPPRADTLLPLVRALFTGARNAESTPLDFDYGHLELARAAWSAFLLRAPEKAGKNGDEICASLDAFLAASLCEQDPIVAFSSGLGGELQRPLHDDFPEAPAEINAVQVASAIAAWLDRTCAMMRRIDPRAVEVVEWRLSGADHREIAERLGLGLRLVERIVADLRAAWGVEACAPEPLSMEE